MYKYKLYILTAENTAKMCIKVLCENQCFFLATMMSTASK